jgi:hypothetical protein
MSQILVCVSVDLTLHYILKYKGLFKVSALPEANWRSLNLLKSEQLFRPANKFPVTGTIRQFYNQKQG